MEEFSPRALGLRGPARGSSFSVSSDALGACSLSLHYSSQPFSEAAVAPRDLVVGYGNLKCGLVDTAGLFVLQAAADDDDRPLPGPGQGGVQQISLEHHEVTLADHHDDVVPLGALGAMTGDGVGELELRPVIAFVVD